MTSRAGVDRGRSGVGGEDVGRGGARDDARGGRGLGVECGAALWSATARATPSCRGQ